MGYIHINLEYSLMITSCLILNYIVFGYLISFSYAEVIFHTIRGSEALKELALIMLLPTGKIKSHIFRWFLTGTQWKLKKKKNRQTTMKQYLLVAVGNIQIGKNDTFFFPFQTTSNRYLVCFGFPSKPSQTCQGISPADLKAGNRRPAVSFWWFWNCRCSNAAVPGTMGRCGVLCHQLVAHSQGLTQMGKPSSFCFSSGPGIFRCDRAALRQVSALQPNLGDRGLPWQKIWSQ